MPWIINVRLFGGFVKHNNELNTFKKISVQYIFIMQFCTEKFRWSWLKLSCLNDLWKYCLNKSNQGNYQKTDIGGKKLTHFSRLANTSRHDLEKKFLSQKKVDSKLWNLEICSLILDYARFFIEDIFINLLNFGDVFFEQPLALECCHFSLGCNTTCIKNLISVTSGHA